MEGRQKTVSDQLSIRILRGAGIAIFVEGYFRPILTVFDAVKSVFPIKKVSTDSWDSLKSLFLPFKDIQEYADVAKDSAYREDILVVVSDHRGFFKDLRKQALRDLPK